MCNTMAEPKEGHAGRVRRDSQNRLSFRDLVDKGTCIWTTGVVFKNQETPHFDKAMTALEGTHWYFASALRAELGRVEVCKTKGRFEKIPQIEKCQVTSVENPENDETVAFRIGDKIWVAGETFDEMVGGKMGEIDGGYMLAHELLHSFFHSDSCRDTPIANMVQAIRTNEEKPLTPETMALQIKNNGLYLVQAVKGLEPYRPHLVQFLNPESPIEQRYSVAYKLLANSRFPREFGVLRTVDRELLQDFYDNWVNEFFQAVTDGDLQSVSRALAQGFDVNHVHTKKRETLERGVGLYKYWKTRYTSYTPLKKSLPCRGPSTEKLAMFRFLLSYPGVDKNLEFPIASLTTSCEPQYLVELISDPNVKVNVMGDDSLLYHAVRYGTAGHVRAFLNRPDLNTNLGFMESSCQVSPLYLAIFLLQYPPSEKEGDMLDKIKLLVASPSTDFNIGRSDGCGEIGVGSFVGNPRSYSTKSLPSESPEVLARRLGRQDVVQIIQNAQGLKK